MKRRREGRYMLLGIQMWVVQLIDACTIKSQERGRSRDLCTVRACMVTWLLAWIWILFLMHGDWPQALHAC